jgi:hypothetical protein
MRNGALAALTGMVLTSLQSKRRRTRGARHRQGGSISRKLEACNMARRMFSAVETKAAAEA